MTSLPKKPSKIIQAEFDKFCSKYDTYSNEYLDMGADKFFEAGFKSAIKYLKNKGVKNGSMVQSKNGNN